MKHDHKADLRLILYFSGNNEAYAVTSDRPYLLHNLFSLSMLPWNANRSMYKHPVPSGRNVQSPSKYLLPWLLRHVLWLCIIHRLLWKSVLCTGYELLSIHLQNLYTLRRSIIISQLNSIWHFIRQLSASLYEKWLFWLFISLYIRKKYFLWVYL